ncbi:hypothetical protein NUACC21_74860 [Scytonema sp. NUACC21]
MPPKYLSSQKKYIKLYLTRDEYLGATCFLIGIGGGYAKELLQALSEKLEGYRFYCEAICGVEM